MRVGSKDLHDIEIKVRLTEQQAKKLYALAQFLDVPPAVVARHLIKQGITRPVFQDLTDNRATA